MFSKTDGPTALRADLVQALSFSHDRIERSAGEAKVSSLAALAGVWNGRKGHVALILRDIEPAAIERYVSTEAISSESELEAAVEEAIAFAEGLGFSMDAPEFLMLTASEREQRIYRWNKLRKVRSPATEKPEAAPPAIQVEPDAPESAPVPPGYEIEIQDLTAAAAQTEPPSRTTNSAGAVIGKIALVRKDGSDVRRLELIARLLASY